MIYAHPQHALHDLKCTLSVHEYEVQTVKNYFFFLVPQSLSKQQIRLNKQFKYWEICCENECLKEEEMSENRKSQLK
jgi:hypothetical protein